MAPAFSAEEISEAIKERLQEHKIVTFKWLSRTMKLHSSSAKKCLAKWVLEEPADKYVVTYTVFGRKENGELLLMLTKETDQDYFKNKNISVIDKYVYSVQLSNSNFDPALIYNIDKSTYALQQMSLSSINYHTEITRSNPKVVNSPVQLNGHQTCRSSPQKKAVDQKPNDVPEKENIVRRTSPRKNKTNNSTTPNDNSNVESVKRKPKLPTKNSKPSKQTVGSGSITNFFGRGSTKSEFKDEPDKTESESKYEPDKTKSESKDEPDKTKSESKSEPDKTKSESKDRIKGEKFLKVEVSAKAEKQKPVETEAPESNRKETRKENRTAPTKSNRKSNKKESTKKVSKKGQQRKRILVLESESEDESNDSDENIDDIPEPEPETTIVQPPETEARIKVIDGKKRKRKVIEDMEQDEDGFMHTTKRVVYESCDSANEEEETTSDKNNSVQSNIVESAPPEKKAKIEITTKIKQSSILSFIQKPRKPKT